MHPHQHKSKYNEVPHKIIIVAIGRAPICVRTQTQTAFSLTLFEFLKFNIGFRSDSIHQSILHFIPLFDSKRITSHHHRPPSRASPRTPCTRDWNLLQRNHRCSSSQHGSGRRNPTGHGSSGNPSSHGPTRRQELPILPDLDSSIRSHFRNPGDIPLS